MTLFIGACEPEKPQQTKKIKPIMWAEVSSGDFNQIRRLSGVLQAARSADLSFLVGGRVKNVLVNLGDSVSTGDILAELDAANYNLNARAAEGELKEAEARLSEASNDFVRKEDLHKKGWISGSALDNARAALDSAESAVATAKARLDLTNKDLADTSLRAPYDGEITQRLIEPSQQVGAGQTVLTIEGREGLEVSVTAPENLISSLRRDTVYKVRFPAYRDHILSARISEIGAKAENANAFPVTLLLHFEDPEDKQNLRAGMTAEVDFSFEGVGLSGYKGSIIRIPPESILAGEGQSAYVFVFNEGKGTVSKRQVKIDGILDNVVLVSAGLDEGEIIAIAGVPFLMDNQPVRLLNVGTRTYN